MSERSVEGVGEAVQRKGPSHSPGVAPRRTGESRFEAQLARWAKVGLGLSLGLAASALAGCTAPKPKAQDLLEVLGDQRRPFHATPEQTFETFRLAFRGRIYDLEYNCLSDGFKERQGVGQTTYREVRDQALGTFLVAWALWKAEASPVEYLDARRARMTASYAGRTVLVEFVREDFWETWSWDPASGAAPQKQDDLVVWEQYLTPTGPEQPPGVFAFVPLESHEALDQLTEVRLGREWKIDHFELVSGRDAP